MEHTNDQAQPTEGFDSKVVIPEVQKDIEKRRKKGVKTYGTELKTFNGRNALVDAYQEALDLAIYLKQVLMEEECELEEDSPPRTIRFEQLYDLDIFFYDDCVYVKIDNHSAKFYNSDIVEHGFTGDEQVIVDSTFVQPFYEECGSISDDKQKIIHTALLYKDEKNVFGVKERLRQYWADQYRKDKEEVQAWVQYCKDLEESRKETPLHMKFIPRKELTKIILFNDTYEPLDDCLVFTDGTESYR